MRHIVEMMNKYEVYVDFMARDLWVEENGNGTYVECKLKVQRMFENILRDFDNVETRSSGSARIIMGTSFESRRT